MASVAPIADQTVDLLKKLSLDSQSKAFEIPEPTKKPSVNTTNTGFVDPTVAYFPNGYAPSAYYYGGYNGAANDWADYSQYVNPDGVDLSHGVYGDMYHGYGYAPYGPYSPAGSPLPTVGQDGQLYGAQSLQYTGPYFQPMTPTSGPKGANAPLTFDSTNGVKGTTGSAPLRPTPYQNTIFNANGSYKMGSQNLFQGPRYGFGGVHSPVSWSDASLYSDGKTGNSSNFAPVTGGNGVTSKNQNFSPYSHVMSPRPVSGVNTASGYMNQMYANKLYNQYGRDFQSFYGYGSNAYDNKYKPRGQGNGFFVSNDGLNELNRGPRTRSVKTQNGLTLTPISIAVKGQDATFTSTEGVENEPEVKKVDSTSIPNREQYNQPDFPVTYEDAKFFVIKSYSEDDVHKSVKYNVWSSTQNGNKKLDAVYQEAQQKSGSCPVFLFFSVNTSGQFVGVAEMVGPVDFNKSLEYWQQDKWIGCFPVKWHIVKDLPNSLLKHIILENNENKPVTNSRDTQEVKLEQGLQVIKIFKEESSKQCILDDFEFYEDRQTRIQEKKAKLQQFQKQVWEGKPKSSEATSVDANEDVKPEEKKITVNGVVANGC